jgi:hypothetical protein
MDKTAHEETETNKWTQKEQNKQTKRNIWNKEDNIRCDLKKKWKYCK